MDLIDRQAAIDEIDEWIKAFLEQGHRESAADACLIQDGIIQLPSAQPEIVRCKDCKYMTEHYDTDGNAPYWTCSEWDSGTDYDGFCHYAERRTDDLQ